MLDMVFDETASRHRTVDFKATIVTDPGRIEHETKIVQYGADSMHFEVDGALQRDVVADHERAEKPGPHDMVEEIVLTVLAGMSLGGAYKWCVDDRDASKETRWLLVDISWENVPEGEG